MIPLTAKEHKTREKGEGGNGEKRRTLREPQNLDTTDSPTDERKRAENPSKWRRSFR